MRSKVRRGIYRCIRTQQELEALPQGTVIHTGDAVFELWSVARAGAPILRWKTPGSDHDYDAVSVAAYLPGHVIWEPLA